MYLWPVHKWQYLEMCTYKFRRCLKCDKVQKFECLGYVETIWWTTSKEFAGFVIANARRIIE